MVRRDMANPQRDAVDRMAEQWAAILPDLPLEAMTLVARLGRIYVMGTKRLNDEMSRHGLKMDEFDVLAALRRSASPGGLTPTELYRFLMLSSAAMTHRLNKLEKAGLVERREDERDRRGFRIVLTKKGRELVDRAVVGHVENEERLLAVLSRSDRETLNGLLKKLLLSFGG